jgi:8-oxo-dGTP diphosphatase
VVLVTAGVIRKEGRILIARRGGADPLAGKWEFPGGKVEKDEKPEDGLQRELREELGIETRVGRALDQTTFRYPNKVVRLLFYEVEYVSGAIALHAHDAVAWVLPEELASYDLAPADVEFARRLSA